MNTQSHILMGAALFGAAHDAPLTIAAIAGGAAPDVPAILMVFWSRFVQGRSPREIFGSLYFSKGWQSAIAPWHSLPVWIVMLGAGFVLSAPLLTAFSASALIHAAIDFFLHADDAHRHFWPLSDWRFQSPVSYWDRAHYGQWFAPFETALSAAFTLLLMTRYNSPLFLGALGAVLVLNLTQAAFFLTKRR